MADTWAHAVAELLDELGHGSYQPDATTGNIFVDHLPPTPDVAVSLWPTGGQPRRVETGTRFPSLQIRVRGDRNGRQAARALCLAIINDLHDRRRVVTGEGVVLAFDAVQSDPIPMGVDGQGRPEFSSNYVLAGLQPA